MMVKFNNHFEKIEMKSKKINNRKPTHSSSSIDPVNYYLNLTSNKESQAWGNREHHLSYR